MQDTRQDRTGSGARDTNRTYAQVVRRYHRLAQQDRQDELVSKNVPLQLHVVHIYLVEKEKLAPASRRVYRSALIRSFLDDGCEQAFQALDILYGTASVDLALHGVLKNRHAKLPRRNHRTIQTRGEPCPASHLTSFLKAVLDSGSMWSTVAVEFYLAGVFTGLRPHAWRGARRTVITGVPALILTGTRTTGAVNRPATAVRMLDDLSPAQVALVDRHLARIRKHGANDGSRYLYEACRQLVRDTARRSIPDAYTRPALDNARDLFCTPVGLALGQNPALYTLWHDTSSPHQEASNDDEGSDGGSLSS